MIRANCLVVALWLWLRSRGHGWLTVRRSHGLHGLIPHFAYAAPWIAAATTVDAALDAMREGLATLQAIQ